MIYRALTNLDAGRKRIEAGQVFCASLLSEAVTERLLEMGRVAPVSTPPLAVLPGWKKRAEMVGPEIVTVSDFIEGDNGELAEKLKATPGKIQAMKEELVSWLSVPKPEG